ncbi:MAG: putative 2-aminoethylphosphonate ABC transporter permease subunit [Castellaniella sp.]|nr:putative 2-aminoethylphosphonate ABC transporter permease subunit [Castellaniella sp.]
MISAVLTLRTPPRDASQRWAGGLAWVVVGLLLLGLVLPLAAILGKALAGADGGFVGLAHFAGIVAAPGFPRIVGNSVVVALSTTAIVMPLAFGFAAALTRTRMPGKPLFRYLALIPLLAPSLLPAISLVYLFGNQGLLKSWFPDGGIYGLPGIVIGEVFYTFPHALMILVTALSVADARLYEAASALGAGRVRQWLTITLPSARYGLVSAAMVVFTLVITDFGVPKVIGGQYPVLAVEAYKQVIGQQNFPKGAVIGLLLLLPAVFSFWVDHALQKRQKALLTAQARPLRPTDSRMASAAGLLVCVAVGGSLLVMLGMAVAAAFIHLWPYRLDLTLAHFDFDDMDGGGWLAYRNSLRLAALTALAGTALVFTGAWLQEKLTGAVLARTLIRLFAMLPMAVPGLVLGLGYVFFFNGNAWLPLYGTMSLLVLCTVAHFYTTAHLTAVTALAQMDREFEAVAASLKVPLWMTFRRVTVPVCLPAILEIARFLFVSAMTTVSAVIFLYTPDTVLASVAVLNMDDAGDTAAAAAMATLIVASSAVVSLLFAFLSGWLTRRTQRWRQP